MLQAVTCWWMWRTSIINNSYYYHRNLTLLHYLIHRNCNGNIYTAYNGVNTVVKLWQYKFDYIFQISITKNKTFVTGNWIHFVRISTSAVYRRKLVFIKCIYAHNSMLTQQGQPLSASSVYMLTVHIQKPAGYADNASIGQND